MKSVNTAFYNRLQSDFAQIAEIIDLYMPGGNTFFWTLANMPVSYNGHVYQPFPGAVPVGVEEGSDLSVSVVNFTLAATGDVLNQLLLSEDFQQSSVSIGRVFIDTPGLGRMPLFQGKMADFTYDRHQVAGQLRNQWKSLSVNFPTIPYMDTCGWRFGSPGCGFNTASVTVALNSVQTGSCTSLILLVASGYLVQSYSNGQLDFGRVTVTAGANSGHVRTIRSHSGDALALSHPLPVSSFSSMQLSVFPGCRKRLIDDCTSRYNNAKNFLGFPYIPVQLNAF